MMNDNPNQGLYEEYLSLTDSRLDSSQYPDMALDSEKNIWLCFQSYKNKRDQIKAGRLQNGAVRAQTVSLEGQALHPRIHWFKNAMWVVWAECVDKRWKLMLRPVRENGVGAVTLVSEAAGVFFPNVVSNGSVMTLSWCEQEHGESRVMMAHWDGESLSEKMHVSGEGQAYRSGICYGDKGELYIAYDLFLGSSYGLGVHVLEGGALSERLEMSAHGCWSASPLMAKTPRGVMMAWYDVCKGSQMVYKTAELSVQNGKPAADKITEVTHSTSWSNHMGLASFGEHVALCHSMGNRMLVLRTRGADGRWSEVVPLVQKNERYYTYSPCVLMDDAGNLHVAYQTANANGQHPRNAEIIYGCIRYDKLKAFEDEEQGRFISPFTKPIAGIKQLARHKEADVRAWLDKNGYDDLVLKFGDIHGQSTMSDGTGEMDHYYNYARYGAPQMDFTALTDHDIFPDVITESEWEFMRTSANEFNKDGEFVTLLAYEWTSNEFRYSFGHKNAYFRTGDGELFRSTDPEGLTPDRLFASLKKYGALCIPHHPAGVWAGSRSHSTDWDFHDSDVQRLVEIFSRHAPYEKYGDTSPYTKNMKAAEGHFVQDALARGYRMGFTGGSDSHQLEHGIEGGILGAFMPKLTRECLFDAMYERFVYATSGAQILVSLKVNKSPMGSELKLKRGDTVTLEGSVLGTGALSSVELIKDNLVLKAFEVHNNSCDFCLIDESAQSGSFYYLRVTQADAHQAWSSPVWVDME